MCAWSFRRSFSKKILRIDHTSRRLSQTEIQMGEFDKNTNSAKLTLSKNSFNRTIRKYGCHTQSPGKSKHVRKCSAPVVLQHSSKIVAAKIEIKCSSFGDVLEVGTESILPYFWRGTNIANSSWFPQSTSFVDFFLVNVVFEI